MMKRRYTCIKMNLCLSSKQVAVGRRHGGITPHVRWIWLVSPWSIISSASRLAPLMNFNNASALWVTQELDTASATWWNKQSLSFEKSSGCHEGLKNRGPLVRDRMIATWKTSQRPLKLMIHTHYYPAEHIPNSVISKIMKMDRSTHPQPPEPNMFHYDVIFCAFYSLEILTCLMLE